MNEEKEVIITENRTLAEDNVNKEPEIIERKSRVSELTEQGKTLCESVQEKLAELSKLNKITTTTTTKATKNTKIAFFFLTLYRREERRQNTRNGIGFASSSSIRK